MAKRAVSAIRALFQDAQRAIEEEEERPDPLPDAPRDGVEPGQWPGFPAQKLPPGCPVVPLGKNAKACFLIDTLGQLTPVSASEWGNKQIIDLFALTPNYPQWAWPRFSEAKKGKPSKLIGMHGDNAVRCLVNACARRGLFDPAEKVRGRGGWQDNHNRFIWHSGDALWTVEAGKLKAARTGEVDDIFYPRRPAILRPWSEPIGEDDTPALQLLQDITTWTFERPHLDPFLVLGWIGCAFYSGALDWRPTLFVTGDRGVGKSTLQAVIKGIIDDALHATADTTAAGIYQRVNQDSLPVAVDELEADASNTKTRAVLTIARLAASGGLMFRGGQDHVGVEFRARNAFLFAAINKPPMTTAEKSRIAMIDLGKIDTSESASDRPTVSDVTGRQILRQLMDAWPRFPQMLADWKDTLWQAGFDGRAQDTYGTLMAVAELMVGAQAMEDFGLPVTDRKRLGRTIRESTASERAEQKDNWRQCLEHLLASAIDAWRSGEKPTIGGTIETLEIGSNLDESNARERLQLAGLGIKQKVRAQADKGHYLAVPPDGPALAGIFKGTVWGEGVWFGALKQAPKDVVRRDLGNQAVVKINRAAKRCLMIDLAAYDEHCKQDEGDE